MKQKKQERLFQLLNFLRMKNKTTKRNGAEKMQSFSFIVFGSYYYDK